MKLFHLMVSAVVLTTNPLFAMDGLENDERALFTNHTKTYKVSVSYIRDLLEHGAQQEEKGNDWFVYLKDHEGKEQPWLLSLGRSTFRLKDSEILSFKPHSPGIRFKEENLGFSLSPVPVFNPVQSNPELWKGYLEVERLTNHILFENKIVLAWTSKEMYATLSYFLNLDKIQHEKGWHDPELPDEQQKKAYADLFPWSMKSSLKAGHVRWWMKEALLKNPQAKDGPSPTFRFFINNRRFKMTFNNHCLLELLHLNEENSENAKQPLKYVTVENFISSLENLPIAQIRKENLQLLDAEKLTIDGRRTFRFRTPRSWALDIEQYSSPVNQIIGEQKKELKWLKINATTD